jgi:hypothetical protein
MPVCLQLDCISRFYDFLDQAMYRYVLPVVSCLPSGKIYRPEDRNIYLRTRMKTPTLNHSGLSD